jgi:hypothetical protein
MQQTNFLRLLLFGALILLSLHCDNTGLFTPVDDEARVEIRLIDGPGDYEKVLIDVVDVRVKFQGEDWVDLDDDYPGTYDLLELTSGVDALLAEGDFLPGTLEEVRLILGPDNFVQIGGELISLRTPSAQQSGLKIKLNNATLEPGESYVILLDFDAGRSVVRAGNSGNYNLKPVIRGKIEEVDVPATDVGAIAGQLDPAGPLYVFAYTADGDTISTYANDSGAFLLSDLPAGTYTVEIVPPESAPFDKKVLFNIPVVVGETTDLGVVELE